GATAGATRAGQASAGPRRRLRLAKRAAAVGRSDRWLAPRRRGDTVATRCPLVRLAARRTPTGPAWEDASVGPATAATAAGWPLAWPLARRTRVCLRARAAAALEGTLRAVARDRPRPRRQGGGRRGRRLSRTLHAGDHGRDPERCADRGVVLRTFPSGRRFPRLETAVGL